MQISTLSFANRSASPVKLFSSSSDPDVADEKEY